MTALALSEHIGKQVYLPMNGICVLCTIIDVKRAYGVERYCIKPAAGVGACWVNASSVHPVQREEAKA
jgi:hypothetical protein